MSASELAKNGALSISLDEENLVQAERSVVVLLPLQGCMEQCCLPAGILWLPSQLYRGSGWVAEPKFLKRFGFKGGRNPTTNCQPFLPSPALCFLTQLLQKCASEPDRVQLTQPGEVALLVGGLSRGQGWEKIPDHVCWSGARLGCVVLGCATAVQPLQPFLVTAQLFFLAAVLTASGQPNLT